MLSYIFHCPFKINLKIIFCFCSNLLFISMYNFNHASWLNWITLCTFLISVHDSMLVLELLYEKHIFLSYKLHTSLLHFLIIILSYKNGKSLCKLSKSFWYSTSTSKIYPILLSLSLNILMWEYNLITNNNNQKLCIF